MEAGGPLLAACLGQRCSALRRLADSADSVDELRSAVRTTPGAVLVAAECLGPCALASVAAIAHRDGHSGHTGRSVWITGIEQRARADALRQWVIAGGPCRLDRPEADLPPSLVETAVGVGAAARLVPHSKRRRGRAR